MSRYSSASYHRSPVLSTSVSASVSTVSPASGCPIVPYASAMQREKTRSSYLCPCSTIGYQALVHLLDPFLRLSLMCQCPATSDSTTCPPDGKSLFRGKADGGFSGLLGSMHLAAELMKCQQHIKATQAKGDALCCARVTASWLRINPWSG